MLRASVLLYFSLSLIACIPDSNYIVTCDQADCSSQEFCVRIEVGGETDLANCEPLPSTCSTIGTCDCVESGAEEADRGLESCFDSGTCTEKNGAVELLCQ